MGARGVIGAPEDLVFGSGQHGATAGRTRAAPEWYDVAWNPTAGCSAVAPGCDRCQARRTVAQLARMGGKGGARYAGLTTIGPAGLQWTGEVRVRADLLTWPLLQRRPRRILVDSMSDLFHEKLPIETIDTLHAVMTIAHWHRFLVLTRRAERMRAYYADQSTPRRIAVAIDTLSATVLPNLGTVAKAGRAEAGAALVTSPAKGEAARVHWAAGLARVIRRAGDTDSARISVVGLDPWPLPNLWVGVAVEDQERISRVGQLLQTPATLRWVCFEPLLGSVCLDAVPVDEAHVDALSGGRYLLDAEGRMVSIAGPKWRPIDWVIAGGEVGAGARSADADWVRGLRDRCVAAGVPFFFKQWGEWAPTPDDKFGRRMVRLGRRIAGRLIDGRSWDEMPAAMSKARARTAR